MELAGAITRLERGRDAITTLVTGVPDDQARWKPEGKAWSILEVVNHLLDEERDDFRMRLAYVIERPGELWHPIDPEGWAASRNYNGRDFAPSLGAWREERERSLNWLRGLGSPDWNRAYAPVDPEGKHVRLAGLRAGDLLLAWVAHDLLHLRQLAKLHILYAAETSPPFSFDYAGRL